MVRRGYGRIVNVASLAGKDGTPRSAAYAASKGAVIALTKAIGKEVAGPACWSTRSPRGSSGRRSSTAFQRETLDFIVGQIPLGRTGQPHEFAALVAFLVSEDLSSCCRRVLRHLGGRGGLLIHERFLVTGGLGATARASPAC